MRGRCPALIASINISSEGFRKRKRNPEKIALAIKLLEIAKKNRIDCVFFPAGYLLASTDSTIRETVAPVLRAARKLCISFILGVDAAAILNYPDDPNSPKMLRAVKWVKIPCFLFVYNASTDKTEILRQRSCTTNQAHNRLLPDEIMTPRTMDINSVSIQVIFCGEVYDTRLLSHNDAPRTAVIIGHWSMPRLSRTLSSKSRMGFTLLNSEHRTGRSGLSYCFRKGKNLSHRHDAQIELNEDLWAEMAVWEVGERGAVRRISFR